MRLINFLVSSIFTLLIVIFGFQIAYQPGIADASFFNPHGNYDISTEGCAICHNTHAGSGSSILALSHQKAMCYACQRPPLFHSGRSHDETGPPMFHGGRWYDETKTYYLRTLISVRKYYSVEQVELVEAMRTCPSRVCYSISNKKGV